MTDREGFEEAVRLAKALPFRNWAALDLDSFFQSSTGSALGGLKDSLPLKRS